MRASTMTTMTRRRRRTRRHSIAVALGVCALAVPASAVALPIGIDNRAAIARSSAGTSQPAADYSSTLRRDGSKAAPFVADVESEPAATADGFDLGDAAIGAGVVLLAVGGTRALRSRGRGVSQTMKAGSRAASA